MLIGSMACPPMLSADSTNQWDNLKQVTRRVSFYFVDRNGDCVIGKVKNVDDTAVPVTRANASQTKIDRADLLRVTDGRRSYNVVFSGRSSWSDVLALIPAQNADKWRPKVVVQTNTGVQYKGQLIDASQGTISLKISGKTRDISKQEVSTVSLVRPKPVKFSNTDRELVFFAFLDPNLWPGIFGRLAVRLYDANSPEDDSPIICSIGTKSLRLVEH